MNRAVCVCVLVCLCVCVCVCVWVWGSQLSITSKQNESLDSGSQVAYISGLDDAPPPTPTHTQLVFRLSLVFTNELLPCSAS